jgi:hypothetical protein
MSLFTHLLIHASFSILVGLLIGAFFGSTLIMIWSAFIFGFLIDVDHLIDYFLSYKKFNLKKFLNSEQFLYSGRLIKLFHAWELVLILLIISLFYFNNLLIQGIFISASLSLFVHLLSDCLINREPLIFYCLSYRINNNFALNKRQKADFIKKNIS